MRSGSRLLFLVVVFIAIVAALNWPLVSHLSTHVIGRHFEDAFEVLWQLDWTHAALFQKGSSPFFSPDVYYPHGWYLASGAQPVWWMVAFSPLTHLLGSTVTYNVVMLATFVMGGLGVCLLVMHLGGGSLAGILAGCVYMVAPVLTLRQGGHLHILLSAQWLPYLALFSHKSLESSGSRRSREWLVAGVFLALSLLGHWQFLFMSPLIPLCIVGFGRAEALLRRRLSLLIRIGLLSAVLVAPFALLALNARAQMFTDRMYFPMAQSDGYSMSPDHLLIPNALHPIWGKWTTQMFSIPSEADLVSIGYVAAVLALLALLKTSSEKVPYVILTALAIMLAMGTSLHWNTQRVTLSLPPQLAGAAHAVLRQILDPAMLPAGNRIILPLPLVILFRVLPLFDSVRVWGRYMIVGMLGIAVLSGLGALWVSSRFRYGRQVVPVLIVIVLLEGLTAPYVNFTQVASNARSVDTWLASQSPRVAVIEYPLPAINKLALYSQSLHGQRVANGYMSMNPTYFDRAMSTLGTWPGEGTIPLLREWKIDYVLLNGTLDPSFQEEILPAVRKLPGLCYVRSFVGSFKGLTDVYVFRVIKPEETCSDDGSAQ
jgi:hypothetical protein